MYYVLYYANSQILGLTTAVIWQAPEFLRSLKQLVYGACSNPAGPKLLPYFPTILTIHASGQILGLATVEIPQNYLE